MSMTKLEKFEKVQRLSVAQNQTRNMLEKDLIRMDLHPGSDIATRWPFIIAAYSGLEQTIKFLILEENSLTTDELHRYRTHNIARLFCELNESTKNVVREYYGRFQSLHSYIDVEKLDDFLNMISGKDGKGYERWRYTLIEDEVELPRNSAEAMITTWGACIELARSRVFDIPRISFPDVKLRSILRDRMENLALDVCLKRQAAGEQFQNLTLQLLERLFRDKNVLNVFAEILCNFDEFQSRNFPDMSDQMSEVMSRWQDSVLSESSKTGMTSLRNFVERAQGRRPEGESIRWNMDSKRFEVVPWKLESLSQSKFPPNAIFLYFDYFRMLAALREHANLSGCLIRENRESMNSFEFDTAEWHRILELSEGDDANPIVTIWHKRERGNDQFGFVELCCKNEMGQRISLLDKY